MLTPGQIHQYKAAYNALITRQKKAEQYFNNNDLSIEERERHMPEFQSVMRRINEAITMLKEKGIPISEDEILNGFRTGMMF